MSNLQEVRQLIRHHLHETTSTLENIFQTKHVGLLFDEFQDCLQAKPRLSTGRVLKAVESFVEQINCMSSCLKTMSSTIQGEKEKSKLVAREAKKKEEDVADIEVDSCNVV